MCYPVGFTNGCRYITWLVAVRVQIVLINFRKEILPFIPKKETNSHPPEKAIECSDVLVVGKSMAVAAHNEDANVALVGHTYGLNFSLCVKIHEVQLECVGRVYFHMFV